MTNRHKLTLILAIAIAYVLGLLLASAEPDPIHITMRAFIRAGDSLSVTVRVDNAEASDTIDMTLANGLHLIDETLTLGTGGIAVWQIPEAVITQAGTSVLVARYDNAVQRKQLTVLPLTTHEIDVFADANNIVAYGEESTTIMILPEDRWGNTPSQRNQFVVDVIYPDTSRDKGKFDLLSGLGLYTLTSQSDPGRVRIEASTQDVTEQLELMQIPSQADEIELTIHPDCLLDDGRDLVTLSISVQDEQSQAVTNGTLITILWDDGKGFARTLDGVATLRLPAFQDVGDYLFRAQVGNVRSAKATLRVVEESCLE